MKVKSLIKRLANVNPEAEIRLNDYNGDSVLFVNERMNDPITMMKHPKISITSTDGKQIRHGL